MLLFSFVGLLLFRLSARRLSLLLLLLNEPPRKPRKEELTLPRTPFARVVRRSSEHRPPQAYTLGVRRVCDPCLYTLRQRRCVATTVTRLPPHPSISGAESSHAGTPHLDPAIREDHDDTRTNPR